MLSIGDMHQYQHKMVRHIIEHKGAMLWCSMGLGKTVAALTAVNTLMAFGEVKRTLVVAPLRVCQTVWEQEARNWTHTRHLRFSQILGSPRNRLNALLNPTSDIMLINYENVEWMVQQLEHYYIKMDRPLPFQCIVWDEVSKMKNSVTHRGKAARKMTGMVPRKIGLTGTPCSNGLQDLHGQFLVLDGGVRLGTHITHFRERFLYQDGYSRKWIPFRESQHQIENLVHDITLQMSAEDYLEVPEFMLNDIYVRLPPNLKVKYDELEQHMITELDEADGGHQIAVFNAGALTNKCLQFANGATYIEAGRHEFNTVHSLKLDALQEIVDESGDEPLLVAYAYQADRDRILKKFKGSICLSAIDGTKLNAVIDQWNRGEIKMLVGHPASMGHGLNLQHGGHTLVWYGLNWSLDLYEQFNARINRQGQQHPVICHRIMVEDTVERTVKEALDSKAATQEQLRAAIGAYADTKRVRGFL